MGLLLVPKLRFLVESSRRKEVHSGSLRQYIVVSLGQNFNLTHNSQVVHLFFFSQHRFLRRQVRWSASPVSLRIFQFVVIHTVKVFCVVNEAEVDVFWNSLAFSMIQQMSAIWSLIPLPLQNPACTSESSQLTHWWSLAWRILSLTLLACEMNEIVL